MSSRARFQPPSYPVTYPPTAGLIAGGPPLNVIAAYQRHLRRRALAATTIRKRGLRLTAFDDWLAGDILTATTEQIELFVDARPKAGARTRYTWYSDLSCFYQWAEAQELIGRNPAATIIRPKLARLLPRPIGEDDLATALDHADRQMRAWLALGAYAGLRCCEIGRLAVDDVMWHEQIVRVQGKGSKERIVPIHPLVDDALSTWGLPRRGHVFTRPRGGPFPAWCISREFSEFFEGLGINATGHQLRHRFGTVTYALSRDLRVTQELLGHSSPQTTAGYAAYSRAEARAAVLALPYSDQPQEVAS